MKSYLIILILCISSSWANVAQNSMNAYDPQALAIVAKHELEQMQPASDNFICLSLPNHRDPSRTILEKVNGHDLHLRRGSDCWKPPNGFLFLIDSYDKTTPGTVKIVIELDNMNLNGAHVAARLKQSTYELQLAGQGWEIKSYEVKAL